MRFPSITSRILSSQGKLSPSIILGILILGGTLSAINFPFTAYAQNDTNYYFEPSSDASNDVIDSIENPSGPDQSPDASTDDGMNVEDNQDGGNDEGVTDGQAKTDGNTSQPNGIVPSEPISDAGSNLEVDEESKVILDGTGSTDRYGEISSYSWIQVDGQPTVELKDAESAQPSFVAPNVEANQELTFQLTVGDRDGLTNTDTVNVLIKNTDFTSDIVSSQTQEPNLVSEKPSSSEQFPSTNCTNNETDCTPGEQISSEPVATSECIDSQTETCNRPISSITDCTDNETSCAPEEIPPVTCGGANETNCTTAEVPPINCEGNNTNCNIVQLPPVTRPCEGNDTSCILTEEPPAPNCHDSTTGNMTGNTTGSSCNPPSHPVSNCPDNFGNMTGNMTDCTPLQGQNILPIADAGNDQQVDENSLVTLDGSRSYDKEGNITSYSWAQIAGEEAALAGADNSILTFYAPQVHNDTILKFELTVTDNSGDIGNDVVDIVVRDVNNLDKIVDANRPEASLLDTESNTAYPLKLLSFSINGTEVGVQTIDGRPDFSLNNSAAVKIVPTNASTELEVNDMRLSSRERADLVLGSTDKDKWVIDAPAGVYTLNIDAKFFPGAGIAHYGTTFEITGKENLLPVANAGIDQSVKGNVSVTLDGSKSFDPDGNISSYQWVQINEQPFITVSGVDTQNPSFISPSNLGNDTSITFRLAVTDNKGANSTDDVTILVKNTTIPKLEGSIILYPIPSTMSAGEFYQFKGILNLTTIPNGAYIQIRSGEGEQTDEVITLGDVSSDGKFIAGWTAVPRDKIYKIYAEYVDVSGNVLQSKFFPLNVNVNPNPELSEQSYSSNIPNINVCDRKPCIEFFFNDWKKDFLNVYITANDPYSQRYMKDAKVAVGELSKALQHETHNSKWNFNIFTYYGLPPVLKFVRDFPSIFINLREYNGRDECGHSEITQRWTTFGVIFNDVLTNPGCWHGVKYGTKHELMHSLGIGHAWNEGDTYKSTGDMLCSVEWYPVRGPATCQNDVDNYVDDGRPTEFDIRAIVNAYDNNGFEPPNNNTIEKQRTDDEQYNPLKNAKYFCNPLPCVPPKENIPPTADAGRTIAARTGAKVILDGSKSFDPDGVITTYSWIQLLGPKVKLLLSATANPFFILPYDTMPGTKFVFQLTVKDDKGLKAVDSVDIKPIVPSNSKHASEGPIQKKTTTITTTTTESPFDNTNPRLSSYATNYRFVTTIGSFGRGPGQLNHPASIDMDPNGQRIYVADLDNNRIQVLHRDGSLITEWGTLGSGRGQFNNPGALAVDDDHKLVFVSDIKNNRIEKFDIQGKYLGEWGALGKADGQFDHPGDIALDPDNEILYVTDIYNNRVQAFYYDGNFITKWGTFGNGNGQFNRPAGIAINTKDDLIYVSDTVNNRIHVFDTDGNFVKKWGSLGSGNGQFARPDGIYFEPSEKVLYVADRQNHRIQVFDDQGAFVTGWTISASKSVKPRDVVLDSSGQTYVVDKENSNILLYKVSTSPFTELGVEKQKTKTQSTKTTTTSNREEQTREQGIKSHGDLSVSIEIAKNPITRGNVQTITVKVTDSASKKAVKNAQVEGSIDYVTDHVEHFSGKTDSSGKVKHSWTISGNASPGEFDVNVDVSASGYDDVSEDDSFEVQPKS